MAVPKVIKECDYAVEVECNEPDTRHWRHPWCYKANGGNICSRPAFLDADAPATIPSCFNRAAQLYGTKQAFGVRPISRQVHQDKKIFWYKGDYQWKTYQEVHADVTAASKGLIELEGIKGLRDADKCICGILADTSPEWQCSAQAAFQLGMPITTVYTTLGQEAMAHGLNETECAVLFLDWGQYHLLEKPVLSKCPGLKYIVLIGKCFVPEKVEGGESRPFPSASEAAGMRCGGAAVTTLDHLIEKGKSSGIDLKPLAPKEDSLAFIMYTSGSTGMPKGVMLTHKNFVTLLGGIEAQNVIKPRPDDTFIAYLPLAHIFELISETTIMTQGARIGYGSAKTLTSGSAFMAKDNPEGSDLLALRPSFMIAVPAILDMIKSGLLLKLQNMEGLKGSLVRGAIQKKLGHDNEEGGISACILSLGLSNLFISKVKKGLGLENLRVIGSGGAPLAAETQDFVTKVLAPVAQGFGATETTGAATIQEVFAADGRREDRSAGAVGPVQPSCEIKLRSVADMGYLVTDSPPRGEILMSGNNVSQLGYYKMKEKTDEDFPYHSDGQRWFHTGDIGEMLGNGTLKIIDRKKDLIKLSGGEYVALGKVEAALKQVPGIGACIVFAKSDKDHCVCIVSQPEKGWVSVGGKPNEGELVKQIEQSLRAQKLARFEIPTKVKLDDMVWTPENGLTTASLKLQRNPLRNHYNQPGMLLEQMDYLFS